jgi:predicted nucleotidyltransferase
MQPITEELIQQIKSRIVSLVHPEKIILFGSHAYGTPTEDSDLDLLIIMPTHEPMHKRALPIKRILREFKIPKDIIVCTPEEVEKKKDISTSFISFIMKEGKLLYG